MRHDLNPYSATRYGRWEHSPRIEVVAQYLIAANVPTFVAYAIAYVGVTAVTSWALRALAPMPEFGAVETGLLTNARGATAAQQLVYGEVRKGGTITFIESNGTNNEYLHQIICLAGHEVNAIGDIYINDLVVTLDNDGNVTSSDWLDSDGNSTILIQKFTGGASQNVYTTLNALTDGPSWQGKQTGDDTNFRGQGIACIYVRLKFDQDVFSQGVPLFTAKVQGKQVYDPRNSTTAYSANAALCVRDYLGSKYGLNNSGAVNETSFAAAANTCDESVTLSGSGTESRYEINGVVSLDRSPSDILADMMTACAGTLFWGAGNWQLKVGEYTTAVKTFTLDDLRSAITLDTKHSRRDNFNVVRGTFVDANSDYVRTDYPEIKGSTFISNDNGIESAIDLALPLTTSGSMAQRLAKMTLFRAREQMTLTADFGMEAFEVQVGDIVGITNARYGWIAKEFEVVGWKFGNNGDEGEIVISLTLRETSSAAFDWNAEESDITDNDSTLPNAGSNLTISSLSTSGGGRTTSDGTFINSVIVSWTAPSNPFISFYEVEHKATADSNYASTTTSETSIELSPLVDGVEYTIRVRAVTISGVRGPYVTATFTGGGDTTAPSLPTAISATGGFKYITINWTNPTDSDLNYVEIYENTSNTSTGATKVGISAGDSFTRTNLGLNQTRYYFLKSVDFSGNASAFTSGVFATTSYLDDADFESGVRQIFIDAGLDLIEPVSALPSSGDFTGQTVYLTSDGKMYNWTGSQWQATIAEVGNVDFSDLTGTLANNQVALNSISGTKITNASISSTQIASNTINAGNIAANAIGTSELDALAVTADKIAANAVTAAKIQSNTITANEIAANTITGGLLATSGIITTAAQISNAVVENAKIANAAVDTLKVAGNSITQTAYNDHGSSSNTSGRITTFNISMPYAGDLVAIAFMYLYGTATSSSVVQTKLEIDGSTIFSTQTSGVGATGPYTYVGAQSVSSGTIPVKCTISNISNITSYSSRITVTVFKRFR